MQEKNITTTHKGLHTDNSPIEQPKDTYRFALNAVSETLSGDNTLLFNDESNVECFNLPDGYIPIGKVYIGNNQTVIFSVSQDEQFSEIGIADDKCNYTTHVNGNLGFKIKYQIEAVYRLRKGCERTIYWVDGPNNKPRYFNFDKPESFKTGGNWDANKFELIRSYQSIPEFSNVQVLNSGGVLEAGSYNISIQYLDDDLNPTEWITVTPIIYVYNDDTNKTFTDIRGSINSETDYLDFGTTDKAILVNLTNLDTNFLYYRLAFLEATEGTGFVTSVKYTETIPTTKDYFIYTGNNFAQEGTEEEVAAFTNVIDTAGSIEQIENRLILANTQGKQVNFCNLQKYASRIKADVITKTVIINQIEDGSPKHPTANFNDIGYQPGEIYSFGIVITPRFVFLKS